MTKNNEFELNNEEIKKISEKCSKFWEILTKTHFSCMDEKQKAYREIGLEPTPKSIIYKENSTTLSVYINKNKKVKSKFNPVFIIPSLINKNYTMDLIEDHSLISYLVDKNIDVYILDWGIPGQEHSEYTLEDMIDGTISRCVKRVLRHSGSKKINMMGQCIGGVLSTIYTAKYIKQKNISSLINITTPIDFSKGGKLTEWTNKKTFNLDKIVNSFKDNGAIPPNLLHAGFPFLDLDLTFNKYRNLFNFSENEEFVKVYRALDFWGNDNIPFACEIFRRFIRDLYQENKLVKGDLLIGEEYIDLKNISIPLFNVMAESDHVFPAEAAQNIEKTKHKLDLEKTYSGGHVTILAGLPVRKEVYNDIYEFIKKIK